MAGKDYYDEAFAQIAQKSGSIHNLLDEFFSFLHRRTDFYVEFDAKVERPSMGFPQGKAEEILLKSFKKYPYVKYNAKQHDASTAPASESSQTPTKKTNPDPSQVAKPAKTVQPTLQYTDTGKQIPIGNGGIGENYYWTQSLTELTIYVTLPLEVRSKDLQVDIKARHLRVALSGKLRVFLSGGVTFNHVSVTLRREGACGGRPRRPRADLREHVDPQRRAAAGGEWAAYLTADVACT